MKIQTFFLQAGGGDMGSLFAQMWPIFAIFLVFYFFMIRPQTKKAKEQDVFLAELEKGDEVVTGSGIIGQINKIEDHIITLQVDTKTFIRVTKGAISKDMTEALSGAESKTSAKS